MRIIITRHGETEENKSGILMGQAVHGTLSNEGKVQAEKLALRLKNEKIDYIYSSNLGRAMDTTKEIMKFHKNIPVEFTNEIMERNLGEFEGKSRKDIGLESPDANLMLLEPERGESHNNLLKRAEQFIHKIIKKHRNETVLIVAHGAINLAFLAVLLNKSAEEMKHQPRQKNTSVNIFEVDEDNNFKVHVLNCTKHLE